MSNSNPQPTTSINEILTKHARWATDLVELPQHQYPDATLNSEQAETALYTLIASVRPENDDIGNHDRETSSISPRDVRAYNQALQDYDNAIKEIFKQGGI